ncbi:hypothetical protein TSOC_004264 [Tetrabaena socialis]|uniref:Uncharacterized protein n=1 Tax=Tetrabaena socialis TaxID=47790 RepID=A0A2J8A9D8_9CHLO|nr:hypothetical protein TSOC_004264 [Tetrabaena socialis]|eukprot:PNH09148.1 hypothetical protein TSOC_004264 [Tetrabaena socialis]
MQLKLAQWGSGDGELLDRSTASAAAPSGPTLPPPPGPAGPLPPLATGGPLGARLMAPLCVLPDASGRPMSPMNCSISSSPPSLPAAATAPRLVLCQREGRGVSCTALADRTGELTPRPAAAAAVSGTADVGGAAGPAAAGAGESAPGVGGCWPPGPKRREAAPRLAGRAVEPAESGPMRLRWPGEAKGIAEAVAARGGGGRTRRGLPRPMAPPGRGLLARCGSGDGAAEAGGGGGTVRKAVAAAAVGCTTGEEDAASGLRNDCASICAASELPRSESPGVPGSSPSPPPPPPPPLLRVAGAAPPAVPARLLTVVERPRRAAVPLLEAGEGSDAPPSSAMTRARREGLGMMEAAEGPGAPVRPLLLPSLMDPGQRAALLDRRNRPRQVLLHGNDLGRVRLYGNRSVRKLQRRLAGAVGCGEPLLDATSSPVKAQPASSPKP